MYLGSGGMDPRTLNLGTCGQLHEPAKLAPHPDERVPSTHWIGNWVGLRAGLDAVVKIKKNPIIAPAGT